MSAVPILNTAASVVCPHGGHVILTTSNTTALADRAPALLLTDVHTVAGCPFQIPGTPPKPQPCVTVRWLVGAQLTRVRGTPVLLQTSVGLCYSVEQIPQGPPVVVSVQPVARGL